MEEPEDCVGVEGSGCLSSRESALCDTDDTAGAEGTLSEGTIEGTGCGCGAVFEPSLLWLLVVGGLFWRRSG